MKYHQRVRIHPWKKTKKKKKRKRPQIKYQKYSRNFLWVKDPLIIIAIKIY